VAAAATDRMAKGSLRGDAWVALEGPGREDRRLAAGCMKALGSSAGPSTRFTSATCRTAFELLQVLDSGGALRAGRRATTSRRSGRAMPATASRWCAPPWPTSPGWWWTTGRSVARSVLHRADAARAAQRAAVAALWPDRRHGRVPRPAAVARVARRCSSSRRRSSRIAPAGGSRHGALRELLAARGTQRVADLHESIAGRPHVRPVTQLEISPPTCVTLIVAGHDPVTYCPTRPRHHPRHRLLPPRATR